ncbi:carbohydrate ABC transporter permease [uncultured Jatrophihabitans sp.]|uniref:carbohydrate ABC transporter permease n=1 Tax=uncultured Jatrophihabitans sp. TaxID=1610747 RepID=UPI0035CA73E1
MTATLLKGPEETESATAKHKKSGLSDRAKQERNLGWKLAAPAFIVMMVVVAYPIIDALYLSFFNYRLTDPDGRAFIWFKNYKVILSDSTWWKAVEISTLIMVITVAVEFVLGMALAMVMNKIVIPRKTLRTIVLIPYSIITVVSAYGFQYAFAPTSGYLSVWLHYITFGSFNRNYDFFGHHWSALIATWCRRSGRPRHSCHCCCSRGWPRCPASWRKRLRSTAPRSGSGYAASSCRL